MLGVAPPSPLHPGEESKPQLLSLFDAFTPRVREATIGMLRLRPEPDDVDDHATHEALVTAIPDHDATRAAIGARDHLDQLKRQLS